MVQIPWVLSPKGTPKRIRPNNKGDDPVEVYRHRYLNEDPDVAPAETVRRVWDEIFSEFVPSSSVLLFGSGHSYWANEFNKFPNLTEVAVLDYVEEAGVGLSPGIEFYCLNILDKEIPRTYDYVYSAHTVEHFDREVVLNLVLPRCLASARKAVVFVVPYGMNWSEDPSHRCVFFEDDELCALATKYKIIRNGQELVLWFDKEPNGL